MSFAAKIALVPLIVLWIWVLPRDEPENLGAEADVAAVVPSAAESLADAFDTGISLDPTSDDGLFDNASTTTLTTTSATVSTTTTALVQAVTEVGSDPDAEVVDTEVAPSTTQTTIAPTTTTTIPLAPSVPIGQLALDRLSFDWQTMFPTWRIEFAGPREGLRALTYPRERIIELFVRSDDTPSTLHRVLAHELGHVIDVELNNDADRARWVQQRSLAADVPWWPSAAAPDFATGAGDFAEAFAVMESGVVSRSTVGSQPTASDLELLRELMRG